MLEHGGTALAESLVIAEYVAEAFASDLRLPAAPAARAAGPVSYTHLTLPTTPYV